MKYYLSPHSNLIRNLRVCVTAGIVFALAVVLTACSTVGSLAEIEHGLSVANKGDSRISNVVIQYGKITRKECVPFCHPKSGGGVWNAPMLISETMQVTWETADGQKRDVTVPVRSRVKDRNRLGTLYLEFSGSQLTITQRLDGYDSFPLYP